MGGSGSGYRWSKKDTVEDCRILDISFFVREGLLRTNSWRPGTVFWTNTSTGERTGSIGYEINTHDPYEPWIRLHYATSPPGGEKKAVDYKVGLDTTTPNYGGLRWWFVCSLVANGQPSWRRAQKLYLPPGGKYFGCRHCHDLTYQSCQDSHKFDRLYADLAVGIPGVSEDDVKRIFNEDQ